MPTTRRRTARTTPDIEVKDWKMVDDLFEGRKLKSVRFFGPSWKPWWPTPQAVLKHKGKCPPATGPWACYDTQGEWDEAWQYLQQVQRVANHG